MAQHDKRRHHHHRQRSFRQRLSRIFAASGELCRLVWSRLRVHKHPSRGSSHTEVMADGRVRKKTRVVSSRPLGNFSSFTTPAMPKYPLVLLLLLLLIIIFIFGELYANRRQTIYMLIGKWGIPADR